MGKTNGFVIFLLIVLVCGIGYLCVSDYREKNASSMIESTNKILILNISDSATDVSDSTQVKNALNSGGQIIIQDTDSKTFEEAFSSISWKSYGANNSKGYMFTRGALLNYIASRGWKLIQAPSTGLSAVYYFTK